MHIATRAAIRVTNFTIGRLLLTISHLLCKTTPPYNGYSTESKRLPFWYAWQFLQAPFAPNCENLQYIIMSIFLRNILLFPFWCLCCLCKHRLYHFYSIMPNARLPLSNVSWAISSAVRPSTSAIAEMTSSINDGSFRFPLLA